MVVVEGGTQEDGRRSAIPVQGRVREDCTETGMQAGPATGRVCSSSG
jgi:hypothetical protein